MSGLLPVLDVTYSELVSLQRKEMPDDDEYLSQKVSLTQ